MNNYYEEYPQYWEPSEVDEVVGEAVGKLTEYIKNKSKSNIDLIIKENKRLEEENKKYKESIDNALSEAKKTKLEYENKLSGLESEFYRSKLRDLMEKMNIYEEVYCVDYRLDKPEKCEICDSSRRIEVEDCFGRKHHIPCKCNDSKVIYEPIVGVLSKIEFWKKEREKEINGCFKFRGRDDTHNSWFWDGHAQIVDKYDSSLLEGHGYIYYSSIEEAQKHCDALNERLQDENKTT